MMIESYLNILIFFANYVLYSQKGTLSWISNHIHPIFQQL